MKLTALVAWACVWLGALIGCTSFDRGYARIGGDPRRTVERNGEQIPYTKEIALLFYGAPTYTIAVTDGEVCIWRDGPYKLFKHGHTDLIEAFDRTGTPQPADIHADYGFCPHCGYDYRALRKPGASQIHCPGCGQMLIVDPHAVNS